MGINSKSSASSHNLNKVSCGEVLDIIDMIGVWPNKIEESCDGNKYEIITYFTNRLFHLKELSIIFEEIFGFKVFSLSKENDSDIPPLYSYKIIISNQKKQTNLEKLRGYIEEAKRAPYPGNPEKITGLKIEEIQEIYRYFYIKNEK